MAVKYEIDLTKMNIPTRLTVTEDTVEIVKTDISEKVRIKKLPLQMLGISKTPVMTFRVNICDITKVYLKEANGWASTGMIQFCVKGGNQDQCSIVNVAFMDNVFSFNSKYNECAQQIKKYVESVMRKK